MRSGKIVKVVFSEGYRAIFTLLTTNVSAIDIIGMIARLALSTVDCIGATVIGSKASRRSLIETNGLIVRLGKVIALFGRRYDTVSISFIHVAGDTNLGITTVHTTTPILCMCRNIRASDVTCWRCGICRASTTVATVG